MASPGGLAASSPKGPDQTGGFISGRGGTVPTPPPAVDISQGRLRTPIGSAPVLAVIMIMSGGYLMWFAIHYWRSATVKWPSDPVKAVLQDAPVPAADPAVPATAQIAVASAGAGMLPSGVPAGQYQTFAAGWHAAGTDTPANNQALGQQMAAGAGWTGLNWTDLLDLWSAVSGWNTTATTSGGGYGIPGARPGSAMVSAGADWATNPATQIIWGLGYIKTTYKTPQLAWSHYLTAGSY